MGISGFFQWLQQHYSDCIKPVPDYSTCDSTEFASGDDVIQRIDNLYLDLNGMIHPCCHDCTGPEPKDEDEMIRRIFEAIDRVIAIARPRKLLYIAIDGVAPQSKLNQQRARRFKAADECATRQKLHNMYSQQIVDKYGESSAPPFYQKWDHNVITPFTPFMERIAKALNWFILIRLNGNNLAGWHDKLTVVLSDAHVPGEGEHKIMHYIRRLRQAEGYDPMTRHCIYGMDADLVVLGLVTHERNVWILRNEISKPSWKELDDSFIVFDLNRYRISLRRDFETVVSRNLENAIDDFVFLCFFVGNDFLPRVPLIDIKCYGLETMLNHYIEVFEELGGYLTKNGRVNRRRFAEFVKSLVRSSMNEFLRLQDDTVRMLQRAQSRSLVDLRNATMQIQKLLNQLEEDKNKKKIAGKFVQASVKRDLERMNCVVGKVKSGYRFGIGDYRREYYALALSLTPLCISESHIRNMVEEYVRGCAWVLEYYTNGCPSWDWFYPFYRAPLLEDIARYGLVKLNTFNRESHPLHPVTQLLAVLPRESATRVLPKPLLKPVCDLESDLAVLYPAELEVDYTGVAYAWQGVIKLPFVNTKQLQESTKPFIRLEEDEGWEIAFISSKFLKEDLLIEERFIPPLLVHSTSLAGRMMPYPLTITGIEGPHDLICQDEALVNCQLPKKIRNNQITQIALMDESRIKYQMDLIN